MQPSSQGRRMLAVGLTHVGERGTKQASPVSRLGCAAAGAAARVPSFPEGSALLPGDPGPGVGVPASHCLVTWSWQRVTAQPGPCIALLCLLDTPPTSGARSPQSPSPDSASGRRLLAAHRAVAHVPGGRLLRGKSRPRAGQQDLGNGAGPGFGPARPCAAGPQRARPCCWLAVSAALHLVCFWLGPGLGP